MTATAPSGVLTFLFTDVEGSTRRWEAGADAMRVALPRMIRPTCMRFENEGLVDRAKRWVLHRAIRRRG